VRSERLKSRTLVPDFFPFFHSIFIYLLPFVRSFLFCVIKLGQAFVLGKIPFRIPSGAQTLAADGFRGFTMILGKGTVLYVRSCQLASVPVKANIHMPCRAPAILRQCRVLRESPRGSRKYPNY
jgi:hypothetical protein